jgi:formylglycine-generating enzyme required for sulfatase activity
MSGHWPRFKQVLCGEMTDRERLGLPDRYQEGRFGTSLAATYGQLRHQDRQELVAVLESPVEALERRYAAGNLLALAGDPRLVAREPHMVEIPGGIVYVGLDPLAVDDVLLRFDGLGLDASWIRKECPRHPLHLARYRIARYPVTNQEYHQFLCQTNYPELPTSWSFRRYPEERANHPVYSISAQACDAYAVWLSAVTQRAFRLPTEAEWEYSAAGPAGLEFPWGGQFDETLANTCETAIFNTTPVGMFPGGASFCGALDLAGNVEEYVADHYEAYPGGSDVNDHLRQIHGNYRVARGGSFARFRDLARTRRRHGHNPRSATYAMGFRLAETP